MLELMPPSHMSLRWLKHIIQPDHQVTNIKVVSNVVICCIINFNNVSQNKSNFSQMLQKVLHVKAYRIYSSVSHGL